MIFIDDNGKLNLSALHTNQQAFVKSTKLHTGIVGGYQSGKSLAASIKAIVHLLINPGVPMAYYLPRYNLFDMMLVPKLKQLFESIGIPYSHHQQKSKFTTPYGEIWMRSMDEPDSIVSYSVGYSIVDEVDLVHSNRREDAMKRISGRNSFKKATPNSIDFVCTPEGFGYMYDFFVRKSNHNKVLLKLSTLDNSVNLGDGYIQGLREQYTPDQLKAYLNGDFVNLTSGMVYKNFDRKENHTDRNIRPGDVLHIGQDFNITNMASVVHVIDEGIYKAVAELTKIYDTETLIRVLNDKYKDHKIVMYPDASGKNRNTSGKSDIRMLMEAGFTIRVGSSNPFVRDRVNAMNTAFMKKKYLVNTYNCPEYTEALEQITYRNNEPDKTSGLDHVTEAGGYFIHRVSQISFTI